MTAGTTVGRGLGRPYWVLWTAASASFLGEGIQFGALPLLAASLTRDPRLVSLTEVASQSGWLLVGLISGVLVDRWRRTSVMWTVDAVRAVVAGAFAAVVLADLQTIPVLLAAGFALGVLSPFFDNASSSVLPELVDGSRLERANAYHQVSLTLGATLIGPPAGAALFVAVPGLPFAIYAAGFAVAAVLVALQRRVVPAPVRTERHLWRELAEGVRYLWRHQLLRALCTLLLVVNLVGTGVVAILVLYVLQVLELPQAGFGWLVAMYAVGGVLGAVAAPRLSRRVGTFASLMWASALMCAGITVMGLWIALAPVVVAVMLAGVGAAWWNVVTISLRQRIVPRDLLGRVTSVYRMVAFAAAPLGALVAGWLAHRYGLRLPYVALGVLQLAATVVFAPVIRRHLRPVELGQ
ncbi:MAG TPA: MFS transporter [Kribbellaceae bacterium]